MTIIKSLPLPCYATYIYKGLQAAVEMAMISFIGPRSLISAIPEELRRVAANPPLSFFPSFLYIPPSCGRRLGV